MKNTFRSIEEAKKDGTEYLLLCKFNTTYYLRIGSFRIDTSEEYNIDAEPMWLDDSHDDYSIGYASCPIDPIGFMEIDFTDFVKEYEANQTKGD